jgi:hypothetical protein
MGLFADWCNWQHDNNNRKQFWKFTERDGGRAKIAPVLPDILRSHYDDMDRIAEDIRQLGFGALLCYLPSAFCVPARTLRRARY